MIDQIRERVHKLTKWEAGFVDSIETESDDVEDLTERQQETLEGIFEKVSS